MRFGPAAEQTVLVRGAGPRLLVWVHGGLWVDGSPEEAARSAPGRCLPRPGWRTALVGYRRAPKEKKEEKITLDEMGSGREGGSGGETTQSAGEKTPIPAALAQQDLALAMEALQPWSQLVLMGHSCGAHMIAAWWQAAALAPPPVAMVAIEGLFDVHAFAEDFAAWRGELELSQGTDESQWHRLSIPTPPEFRSARWLVLHAPEDPYVNMRQPEEWIAKLREAGVPCESRLNVPGIHFSAVRDGDAAAEAAVFGEINRLLDRVEESVLPLAAEERHLAKAGYRDGIDEGREAAAQEHFARGVALGPQGGWDAAAQLLGQVATARRLTKCEEGASLEQELQRKMEENGADEIDPALLARWQQETEALLAKLGAQ